MPVLGFLELNLGVIAACLPTFIALSKFEFFQECRHRMTAPAKSIRFGLRFPDSPNHKSPKDVDSRNDLDTDEERPRCKESSQSIMYSNGNDTFENTMYSKPVDEEHNYTRPADRTEQHRSWIMR